MKPSSSNPRGSRVAPAESPLVAGRPRPARDPALSDDEREIRYSLTALGELALASGAPGRGRRFRGFGPCGAVA